MHTIADRVRQTHRATVARRARLQPKVSRAPELEAEVGDRIEKRSPNEGASAEPASALPVLDLTKVPAFRAQACLRVIGARSARRLRKPWTGAPSSLRFADAQRRVSFRVPLGRRPWQARSVYFFRIPPMTVHRAARSYKFYDVLLSASVAVLLCSNLIGPGKTVVLHAPGIGGISFGAGNIFFPISYIFGDVFTEVYGYARARKAIWVGFGTMTFAASMSAVVIHLPVDPNEPFNRVLQPAIEVVFGNTWRITVASLAAYWAGDFVNSFVLAEMKLMTGGRYLWTRTIGSTVAGQLVDSAIFYPLSFFGIWKIEVLQEKQQGS